MKSLDTEKYMTIDGIPTPIEGEKNILELIRKIGLDLPTFCYNSDLSVYGACRMCVVESDKGEIMAACSTPPKAGVVLRTNTPRVQRYRKSILELMLADHCRDCTTCEKNGNCKLQELAAQYGIKRVRFDRYSKLEDLDFSSYAIVKDKNKCILCGDCVRMCSEMQHVGAIDFVRRGSKLSIEPAFNMDLAETNCVNCGQCAAICPTGALTIKDDSSKLWEDLNDDSIRVIAQIAPAVRVALGDEFNLERGENVMGKIIASLKRLGFDEVYDTATGADLTIVEESKELIEHIKSNSKMPLFTSCCPSWVKFAENKHPDLVEYISSCKSPMEMFGSVLKEQAKKSKDKRTTKVVAIMPCTSKKAEIKRPEFYEDGEPTISYSISTVELSRMIKKAGLVFDELLPQATDMPFGLASSAGIIFGATGGVTEAVIRNILGKDAKKFLRDISLSGVRGFDNVKEIEIPFKGKELRIAVVSGLGNADKLIKKIKSGEVEYDFVEVMACNGGCISGAGQPFVPGRAKEARAEGIYETDREKSLKITIDNPVIEKLYDEMLSGEESHRLLHYK